ncbi:3-deoxy-manno-octulosonate cytidylyltransferase [Candidatus Providencia siddallii]|uniref:3-deoxy-manno-octulosonate cytidylyltransferase n=1 Tax=Candidatus Providencia siddallii TaxID=1715285 RepID=A0A0M6W8G4_9GAMM|nr:3-deoxy-manno-octulosonate cytidylyltransferase [Candidatus Providencia siddallii]
MMFNIIIPARYHSTRLPGKPLADIHGKPMVVRVMEQAIKTNASRVIIATDHKDIANVITKVGGEVCMTKNSHLSGTERIAEVIDIYGFSDNEIIVNVQGDEPLIIPELINEVAYNFINKKFDMITLATYFKNPKEIFNSNIVKVVTDKKGCALYFSRATIPWSKNYFNAKHINIKKNLLRHIGIYAYSAGFIRNYIKLKSSQLEKIEMLEQIRVLWHGKKIYVNITDIQHHYNVDTLKDLELVRKRFKSNLNSF